ncbi:lysosomal protective protein-like isoform X2 [Glandiceps talaboti]
MKTCMQILLLTFLCNIWLAASRHDNIDYLPGLAKQPSFKHFSGYLAATGSKQLHYWYVESQNKPTTDPIILWLSGGPGCSSLDGLLSEHGPYLKANVLYLESPAGVGFSYSDDGKYATDDDQVVEDNYQALKSFFEVYTSLKNLPLFIMGEDYGGVYVPTLAAKIMTDTSIKLQGFAVGNGITSYEDLLNSLVYFSYYHGLFGTSLWNTLKQTCCANNGTKCDFYNNTNPDCQPQVEKVTDIVGNSGLNPYNLYADCAGGVTQNLKYKTHHSYLPIGLQHQKMKYTSSHKLGLVPYCRNATAITRYLNDPYVKEALHIKDGLPDWQLCSDAVFSNYTPIYMTLKEQYLTLLGTYNYRILVYSGDVDVANSFLGNEWFIESLNLEEQVQRRAWLYNDGSDQVAGFVKEFENLAFATVKGAGHMAPKDNRKATQQLVFNFLEKKPY